MTEHAAMAPVRRRSLGEEIVDRLRTAVAEGVYRPGDRLRQEEIAAQLGVSRTPVREALAHLAQQGVVEETTQGFRIAQPEWQEVLDLFEVCAAIEGATARLAAGRIDEEGIDRLEAALRGSGEDFHDLVAEITGNRSIARLRPVALAMTALATHDVVSLSRADRAASKAQHAAILDALRRGDGRAAERATREHFADGRKRLAAALGER